MNTSEQKLSQKGYIILLLQVPGLSKLETSVEKLPAPLVPRLIEETIERALTESNLLSPLPLSLAGALEKQQKICADAQHETEVKYNEGKATLSTADSQAQSHFDSINRLGHDVLTRLTHPTDYAFVIIQGSVLFWFKVSDVESGLKTVFSEVKRIGFLELAEIGRLDLAEGAYSVHHPTDDRPIVLSKNETAERLIGMIQALEEAWQLSNQSGQVAQQSSPAAPSSPRRQ